MHTATPSPTAPHRRPYKPIDAGRVTATRSPRPAARRVTIALDAFPEWPAARQMHGLSDAAYWEIKALDHITTLVAAHLLHKQVTSGTTVPRSLSYALNAMQVEIGNRIRRAIRRHVSNGGTREAELRQAWELAA